MLAYYRIITQLISPFVPLWLWVRVLRGKEERGRIKERYGITNYGRAKGKLLWIHAASVGEANSVLSLIARLRNHYPQLQILLTTVTVTSARLMKERLPQGVIHQYLPIDTPSATQHFMRHWLPDFGWFIESELWPNIIAAAKEEHCLLAIVNGRISARSFARWQKMPRFAAELFSAFSVCFAGSDADAKRFEVLGAKNVLSMGNIKYDASLLGCNEADLLALKESTDKRVGWLAASTHAGEEEQVAKAHAALIKTHPNLLTLIVPRHAQRGPEIAATLSKFGKVALRSKRDMITAETQFYVADTMGELGLFYRLCDIVFMGGSLVNHGGQNPLEPARFACAILSGPYLYNFADIYREMQAAGAAKQVANGSELAKEIQSLLNNYSVLDAQQTKAKQLVESKSGASDAILKIFHEGFAT